jgi:hypothetical protein
LAFPSPKPLWLYPDDWEIPAKVIPEKTRSLRAPSKYLTINKLQKDE